MSRKQENFDIYKSMVAAKHYEQLYVSLVHDLRHLLELNERGICHNPDFIRNTKYLLDKAEC